MSEPLASWDDSGRVRRFLHDLIEDRDCTFMFASEQEQDWQDKATAIPAILEAPLQERVTGGTRLGPRAPVTLEGWDEKVGDHCVVQLWREPESNRRSERPARLPILRRNDVAHENLVRTMTATLHATT